MVLPVFPPPAVHLKISIERHPSSTQEKEDKPREITGQESGQSKKEKKEIWYEHKNKAKEGASSFLVRMGASTVARHPCRYSIAYDTHGNTHENDKKSKEETEDASWRGKELGNA